MSGPRPLHLLLCLAALLGAARLPAQELSFLFGGGGLPNLRSSSYSWDLDYRQCIFQNLSGSVGWVNEGHISGHHRDGTAAQLWLSLPMFDGRFNVSAGAGGYYYFDTVPLGNGDSADLHGTGPIFSFSATGYVTDRMFVRFLINRINPHDDFHSNTALLGAGFWFGLDRRPTKNKLGGSPTETRFVTGSELTVYTGRSVVNAYFSEHGLAYAAEYRRGLSRHLDGTISYIYEGDPKVTRRSGLGLQAWPVNTFFNERVTIGFGSRRLRLHRQQAHGPESPARRGGVGQHAGDGAADFTHHRRAPVRRLDHPRHVASGDHQLQPRLRRISHRSRLYLAVRPARLSTARSCAWARWARRGDTS